MSINCMNCGAMLIGGEKVCPVCRQPVAPAQGAGGWQEQPGVQPVTPWPQPTAHNPYAPPPGASSNKGVNAFGLGIIGLMLVLLLLGGGGYLFYYLTVKKTVDKINKENEELRELVSDVPVVQDSPDDANSTPPPRRTSNNSRAPISGGILNGKATSLPKPAYPAIARTTRASGTVVVQVTVDESGKVTEARAVSGHPLLHASAVAAARAARFSPTLLSGKPVKVRGLITYNFTPE